VNGVASTINFRHGKTMAPANGMSLIYVKPAGPAPALIGSTLEKSGCALYISIVLLSDTL